MNLHARIAVFCGAVAFTWPIWLARWLVDFVFRDRRGVTEPTMPWVWGLTSLVVALMTAWSLSRKTRGAPAWPARCTLAGVALADLVLAAATSIDLPGGGGVFVRSLLGGVFYAGPVGAIAGLLVGLQAWALGRCPDARRRALAGC
jgi:hypothetical protein